MNVLLVGGCGSLINNLIIKFNKEGHRVYLLTGDRYSKAPYQKVFEKYKGIPPPRGGTAMKISVIQIAHIIRNNLIDVIMK